LNWDIITISRKELYEQVWSEPVMQLAKRYGFSDVWLAKICRRHDIPRPPRGYWARKQSGQKVPRTPLPKRKDGPIKIYVRPFDSREQDTADNKDIPERRAIPNIVVPEVLKDPHPLIKTLSEILASCKPDRAGILVPSVDHCLNIRVSRESLPRALRIMDALIKTVEAMGFDVSIPKKETQVKVLDVSINIGIGEELYRRRLKAKDHDLDRHYYDFGFNRYEDQAIPSGRLFLSIGDLGFYSAGECRKNWRDTETKRLEDSLKSFMSGLIKAATLKKARTISKDERALPENEAGSDI